MKSRFIAALSAVCLALAPFSAYAAPAVEPVTYSLIRNGNASGPAVGVTGGSYMLDISGTFGGSTLGLSVTTNGVTSEYDTWTSAPSDRPCFNIPTGSIVQATLTGGTPSGFTATLGGVGSGGCATGSSGGAGDASAANQEIGNASLASIVTNTGAGATAAGQAVGNTNTGNIATAVGSQADAAWTSGSGSVIGILKGIKGDLNTPNPDCGSNPCTNRIGLFQPEGRPNMGATTVGYQAAASTNCTNVKNAAGTMTSLNVTNSNTTKYFLRTYNLASAPTASSATGFVQSWEIPAASAAGLTGGATYNLGAFGHAFTTGIGFCITGGDSSTDNTNAATGVKVQIGYF